MWLCHRDKRENQLLTSGISQLTFSSFSFKLVVAGVDMCNKVLSKFWRWQDEVEALLYFAEKYDVQRMKEDIEKVLMGVVNPKNAFSFLGLSFKLRLPQLESIAASTVHSGFMSGEVSANLKVSPFTYNGVEAGRLVEVWCFGVARMVYSCILYVWFVFIGRIYFNRLFFCTFYTFFELDASTQHILICSNSHIHYSCNKRVLIHSKHSCQFSNRTPGWPKKLVWVQS